MWPSPLGDHMPSSAVVCMGAFGICVANGHNSDAAEVVRSLFSWAEFMAEEPVERQNRRGNKEASSLSLFEWALSLEEERGRRGSTRGADQNYTRGPLPT